MMPGIPGGRQFAVSLSSRGGALAAAARSASYFGVKDGPPRPPPPPPRGGAAVPRPPAGAAFWFARWPPPPPPPPLSQTPLKSGSLARPAQSEAVGALYIACCASAENPTANAINPPHASGKRILCLFMLHLS